jgi:anti-sigma28 factor (negative regulator of flagellin synthesis)
MKKQKELDTADARTQRIAKLRKAIESGTYTVSAEVLAETMLERMRVGDETLKDLRLMSER